MTVISLPAGPTAYFRLTSIQMGQEIAVSPLVSRLAIQY
jgi:hypothetical protein